MIRSKSLGLELRPALHLGEVDVLAEMALAFPIYYSVRVARLDAASWIDFNKAADDPRRVKALTLLAYVGETIVGFVRLKWNKTHADVQHLAVHPDHQGLGYLDKMVKLLKPFVFDHLGMETCWFDVLDQSEHLKGYCERRDVYTKTWTRKSERGEHDLHRQVVSREAYLEDQKVERVPDLELLDTT